MEQFITKKRLVITAGIAIFLGLLYFFLNYSFVLVQSPQAASVTLTQKGETIQQMELPAGGSERKLLKKGFYEIFASNGNNESFIQSFQLNGKLQSTTIETPLKKAVDREFIGENPIACVSYVYERLLSYPCNSKLTNASLYVPPTATTPGYATKPFSFDAMLEGVTKQTNNGPLVIVRAPAMNEGFFPGHSAYRLTNNFNIERPQQLAQADPNAFYEVIDYREGFVLFSPEIEPLYYSGDTLEVDSLEPNTSPGDNFNKTGFSAYKHIYAITYNDQDEDQEIDLDDPEHTAGITTKLIVVDGDTERAFSLDGYYASVTICGEDVVCALKGDSLSIHKINDSELAKQFEYHAVLRYEQFSEDILITTGSGVAQVDLETGGGFYHIGLQNQQACGTSVLEDTYILCTINSSNKKAALLVNPQKQVSVEIDEVVNRIHASSYVQDVSAYKNTIYISPDYGDREVLPDGGIGYPPDKVQQVDRQIAEVVRATGLNLQDYLVQTTFLKRITN